MKKIGGFFELELSDGKSIFHDDAIKLNTGRACLNYILKVHKPSKLYIPFYSCDVSIEPIIENEIEYEFYGINDQFEIINKPILKRNEFIICCDFFGIKTEYVNKLMTDYKDQLIVDNTHSFFQKGYLTTPSFTTARKYFGVPDGAFLYMIKNIQYEDDILPNVNVSINHNLHSLLGLQDLAFSEFLEYENKFDSNIKGMSLVSKKLLSNVNFDEVREIRNRNFNFFRNEFDNINTIVISENSSDCFCYPLLLRNAIDVTKLHAEQIFVPSYWKDTLNRQNNKKFELECKLSSELLPLPIDHRYNLDDLKRVSETIKRIIKLSNNG